MCQQCRSVSLVSLLPTWNIWKVLLVVFAKTGNNCSLYCVFFYKIVHVGAISFKKLHHSLMDREVPLVILTNNPLFLTEDICNYNITVSLCLLSHVANRISLPHWHNQIIEMAPACHIFVVEKTLVLHMFCNLHWHHLFLRNNLYEVCLQKVNAEHIDHSLKILITFDRVRIH